MNRPRNQLIRGKGTAAMLIGLAVFAAYSFATKPSGQKTTYLEADASGRLVKVSQPTEGPTAPPLWKPEPDWMLKHTSELQLTPDQLSLIGTVSQQWRQEKDKLELAINGEVGSMKSKSNSRMSIVEIQSDMKGYSDLSRTYELQRRLSWSEAESALSSKQLQRLGDMAKREGGQ